MDERTLSLIKRAREDDAGTLGKATSVKAGHQTSAQEQESDDSEDDLEDDVFGSIAVDWRANGRPRIMHSQARLQGRVLWRMTAFVRVYL